MEQSLREGGRTGGILLVEAPSPVRCAPRAVAGPEPPSGEKRLQDEIRMRRYVRSLAAIAILALGVSSPEADDTAGPLRPAAWRVAAEFERDGALLLSCREFASDHPEVLAELVESVHDRMPVCLLIAGEEEAAELDRVLALRGIPPQAVRKLAVSHDTMWLRDYGPGALVQEDGREVLLDPIYPSRADRENDDALPVSLSDALEVPVVSVPLEVDGGNLLTNGQGLFLTTTKLLEENGALGHDEETVRNLLATYYRSRQTIFLEPLEGEETGHVDMFATFPAADTVVVGAYTQEADAVNAQVLDRNARQLAHAWTERGSLRVVRIPMPPNQDGVFRTYTNVIYARGVLIVPQYGESDPVGLRVACEVYTRLLPGWSIRKIEAESLAALGGSLHCVSLNIPRIGRLRSFGRPAVLEWLSLPRALEYRLRPGLRSGWSERSAVDDRVFPSQAEGPAWPSQGPRSWTAGPEGLPPVGWGRFHEGTSERVRTVGSAP